MDYEKGVEKLENIVNKLDNEKISLEESIKLYGEGIKLVKDSMEKLNSLKGDFEILNSQMKKIEIEEDDDD